MGHVSQLKQREYLAVRKLQVILGVCFAVAVATSSLVIAGFDEGIAVFRKGDFTKALQEFRVSAKKGGTDAQFYLGLMYSHGLGVVKDHKESVKWYLKAAEQGHAKAQYIVGLKYDSGEGFVQDYEKAVIWYQKAAKQGSVRAQYALGLIYSLDGGFAQDYVRAHMWLNIAGVNGNEDALDKRDIVEQKMSTVQIAEARKLARAWMRTHCQQSLTTHGSSGAERIMRQQVAKPDCKVELKGF